MGDTHHPHIALSRAELGTLLGRPVAGVGGAEPWPRRDPAIAGSAEIAAVCSRIREALRDGPGYVVLKIDPEHLSDTDSLKAAYWNLFTSLGTPIPQYSTGEMVFEVEVAPSTPLYSHYSRSNRGGGYHTDGTFLPRTPFYAGLICLRQAEHGGDTILIDGRRLYGELSAKHGEALERLKGEFYFDCCGQLPGLDYRPLPVISWQDSSLRIKYLRSYIVEGHAKAEVPLDERGVESLDTLDALLDSEELQHVYKLNPGEMLIFNNYIMLHGRKPFYDEGDGPSRRLLLRVYAGEDDEA